MRTGLILLALFPISVFAWEGYESDSGNLIEIDDGSQLKAGKEIEVYDWSDDEYKTYEVQQVLDDSIEVYDYGEGEFKFLEMQSP